MWDCKRLWLLFIALLYLKDVRALGVWSKKPAQDWYSIAAQIPQAQPKEPASLHDGAQISTAMRDEGFQSQDIVSYVQATSNQDVSNTALQNSYGTASVTLPSGNTVYSSMYQQRPQVPSTSQTSQSWMQNASSYSSSQSPSVYWQSPSSLSSQYLGSRGPQNVNQVSSASGLTTTQQAASSIVSSGSTSSTSSSSSGSQSPSVYWQSPSSLSSQYLGSRGPQNVNQVSSASGLTTTQQAASSIVSSGSTSSTSSSSSGSQSPSVYWQSPSSLSSQYLGSRGPQNVNQVSSASGLTTTQQAASSIVSSGSTSSTSSSSSGSQSPSVYWQSPSSLSSQYLGSRGPQNVNQVSSASGLTTTQQAASSIVSSGSTSSTSSSSSGSQSPSVYWQSPSSLSSQYLGSRGPQNVNQVSSASGLTTTQQAASSIVSSGSTSSTSSSSSGSQSPSVYWQSPSSLSSQYLGSRGPQNVNQVSSASGLTTTQQAASSIVSSGSTSSTSSSSSGSQSPSVYWQSPSSLSSQYLGSRGPQNVNQVSSASGLTTTQQAASSIVSSGSTSSTSSSSSGSQSPSVYWQSPSSQSQSSTGYGLSQWLASRYGGFRLWPDQNQLRSAPALTLTQQAAESGMSSGSTTSGISSISYSGFQSPSTSWLSRISKPTSSTPTQQGINQLGSVPRLTVIQPASDSAVSTGSTSGTSSSYSCSPSSTSYGQSLSSLGSHGQQSVNQMSSAPGLTVTQPSTPSVVSSDSTSSSYTGSQSQPSTGYGLSQWLANQYGKFQTQQGINENSSAPGLTVIQPASDSAVSNDSSTSMLSSYTSFQSPSVYWQSPSSLSSQSLGSQGQQNVNQVISASGLTTTQQAAPSIVSSGSTSSTSSSSSGSQSPSVYWQSPSSFTQYLGSQGQQSVNQMSSASGLTVAQQSTPSVVSSGSTITYTGSQTPPTSWLFGLSKPSGSSQTQHGISQLGSVPGFTGIQPTMVSAVSNGYISTSSSSSGSQSPSSYWPSQSSLSSQYLGSRGQQNVNQVSSASGLTTAQQAASSIVSSGSTSSSSSGYQSPSTYWPSQSSLSIQNLGSQGQQGINQLSSSPGLTVTQQSMPSVASSGSASSTSSSSSGSQSPSAYWQSASSLSSQYLGSQGQRVNQLTSVPGLTVIQPAFPSLVLSGSTSSSYTGSQGQDSSGYGTFQVLTSQHGSSQTPQGTNQMSSAPSLTVTQLSMPSVASSGSTSSTSSSSSGSQSPSAYWQSASSLSKYFGSQGQQGINQMSSAPGLTVIQPASDSAVSNGSATSVPGSYTSFQSPSTYWQSASSLSSQYLGSQGQHVNQLTPVPGLTVIQPASPSLVSSGSSSSPTGPQSQVSTGYGTFQVLASQHGGFQTPQGTNQMSSAPSLTLIPLSSDTAVTNGSAVGTLSSYGGSQSQGSTVYGLSQGLPSQPGRLQMQLGINQRNSTPVLTTTQQAAPSIVSSGSTSSTSSAYMPSQSQSSTGHGLSQWLVNRYGSFEMWPEQNQQGSAPALTMTQQVVESGMSSGSTTSGISSIGSQSPSTSWLSGISKPTDGTPTLQGLSQPASVAVVTNGSTVSASGSYGVFHIQSPPAYWQSQSSLSSQYLGSQGLQSVNQLSSAPGLTVTQQAAPSVVSSGTTSTSSSPTGFQSQSTSGYWSSQELSNHHDGLQTQGTQQLNQQASSTLTSSSPNVSTSNTTTSNLGIQSKNVQKPQAFNLWMGRYPCKSDSSSNASKLS